MNPSHKCEAKSRDYASYDAHSKSEIIAERGLQHLLLAVATGRALQYHRLGAVQVLRLLRLRVLRGRRALRRHRSCRRGGQRLLRSGERRLAGSNPE